MMNIVKQPKENKKREKGFVLVTSLVLIAILTILGTVSFYKTNVETRVSRVSADNVRALSAANAGLSYMFAYWGNAGSAEYTDLIDKITKGAGGATPPSYYINEYPDTVSDLGASTAAIDAWVGSKNVNVYTLNANGTITADTWGNSGDPQVAVWAVSYNRLAGGDYPYLPAEENYVTNNACSSCRLVVYALGRSGNARTLLRENQSVISQQLQGVDAITNAPQYATWMDACHETASTGVGSALSWPSWSTPDALVEATQSAHSVGVMPSGTAMSSNANMGKGGKMFRKDVNSSSELTMDSVPLIAYALHNTASGVRVNWANVNVDTYAADDPFASAPKELPTGIMLAGLSAGGDKMDYFLSGNAHLFNLDAYRWAAEQFTCQDPTNFLAAGNGAFCDKAEALRLAMGSPVPVTGRLTLEQFEKNVADGRPMFGIVRVLWPTTTFMDSGEDCESAGGRHIWLYDLPASVNKVGVGKGQFHPATSESKVMIYGMFLLDYFTDNDSDYYFDADAERLIEPIESVDAYLKIEIPLMVNPAVPADGGAGGDFYTIAATTAPAGSTNDLGTANRINPGSASNCTGCRSIANLASPYDGWFPSSEGLIDKSNNYNDGSMALMDLTHGSPHGQGLIGAANEMRMADITTTDTLANSLFNTYKNRLNYYYELMYTTTDQSDSFSWPITDALPGSFTSDFCIGDMDCDSGNNDSDKFHLLFPNGYVHGIKVALATLDITADEWNNVLSGNGGTSIVDLATDHTTLAPYGDTTYPLGSPFGQEGALVDAGMADAATIMADQTDYFFITEDATSGYGIIDSEFKDLPSIAYSGGLIDTHSYNNVGGILYTPGPLEWEVGNKGGLGYVAGSVITGFGLYNKSGGDKGHQVYVFDPQAVDNISTQAISAIRQRFAWQNLK